MGIAHICMECGQGLSRVRAQLDPHYGLSLVTCPRCEVVAVRHLSPAMKQWQAIKRSIVSFGVLGLQVALTVALLTLTIAAIISLQQGEFSPGRGLPVREYYFGLVMLLGVLPMFTGAWLTFAFRHLKLPTVLVGWVIVIISLLSFIGIMVGIVDDVSSLQYELLGFRAYGAGVWIGLTSYVLPCMGLFALMMMMTLVGIIPGRLGTRLFTFARRRQQRWLMKQRRLRRSV